MKLLRGHVFHTPEDPFKRDSALESFQNGAVVIDGETIVAIGNCDDSDLSEHYPDAEVIDERGAFVLPGLVDTHVHFPQVPVIGSVGLRLLEWLDTRTLPEEMKFADTDYAREQAQVFLRLLAKNGTTTALVFGAHFAGAVDALFNEADKLGLRITTGLVLGDRLLKTELHTTPERAYQESRRLIERWHGRGRLRYAVTPRFSLSCTNELLAVCGCLLAETPDLFFTSHINEQLEEIKTVLDLFPAAQNYLDTYGEHNLVTKRSVFAHSVHVQDAELEALAVAGSSVAHCPSSNMFIGSGLFSLRRHLEAGVGVALGSDVGGGTGFSLFKEGLNAYQVQMLQADGVRLNAAHLLYLATLGGAKALGLDQEIGDFTVGKQADLIIIRPPADSTLAATLAAQPKAEDKLAALFTLAREESVQDVWVAGTSVL